MPNRYTNNNHTSSILRALIITLITRIILLFLSAYVNELVAEAVDTGLPRRRRTSATPDHSEPVSEDEGIFVEDRK